jgi:hypothetical protein
MDKVGVGKLTNIRARMDMHLVSINSICRDIQAGWDNVPRQGSKFKGIQNKGIEEATKAMEDILSMCIALQDQAVPEGPLTIHPQQHGEQNRDGYVNGGRKRKANGHKPLNKG